ncbi:hypothetical protein N7447_010668, partial [Penicillium robsamsonii]|uniref:uncharacterized protein n=1 Tax=Penicillium robsamsonii TaxID=1792511 RepID=UPI0025497BC6
GGLWSHGVYGKTTEFDTSIQSETGFMGWYLGPENSKNTLYSKSFSKVSLVINVINLDFTAEAMTDPKTWTTSGNYAAGCNGNSCRFATNCANNNITYDDGLIGSCGSATCVTMTIFQTFPYATPSASNIFCGFRWKANTIYRELEATTTESSTAPPSSPTPSTTTLRTGQFPTTTPAPTKPISTTGSSVSQSPTSTAATTTTSSSKAWIAGVVVGPIAGIALIAGLIFWWNYRRKAKQPSLSQEQLFMAHGPPQSLQPSTGYPPHQSTGYPMENYKQMHELDTAQTPRLYELGSTSYR